jgi:hypothetical protein
MNPRPTTATLTLAETLGRDFPDGVVMAEFVGVLI